MTYVVTAHSLFLRKEPVRKKGNERAALPQGTEVQAKDLSNPKWWLVSGKLNGASFEGYVASAWLEKKEVAKFDTASKVAAVHWKENNPGVKRSGAAGASPIGETGMPRSKNGTASDLNKLIDWLEVEASKRYKPGAGKTYCNIYSYDVAYASGVYLPRVWWMEKALIDLAAGKTVAAQYGKTIHEMNANAIHDWLQEWGPSFGWRRTFSFTDMQDAANAGRIAVICAKRKDLSRSGHIVLVAPETASVKALRGPAGKVFRPVTSQAGSTNFRRKVPDPWWVGAQFSSFVLFLS